MARAWRLAVGPASTQTLGLRTTTVQHSSRKCACRREWNSHDAAKPRMPVQRRRLAQVGHSEKGDSRPISITASRKRRPAEMHVHTATAAKRWGRVVWSSRSARMFAEEKFTRVGAPRAQARSRGQSPMPCFALQGAERHAKSWAGAADAGYRDCSSRAATRESGVARLQ